MVGAQQQMVERASAVNDTIPTCTRLPKERCSKSSSATGALAACGAAEVDGGGAAAAGFSHACANDQSAQQHRVLVNRDESARTV